MLLHENRVHWAPRSHTARKLFTKCATVCLGYLGGSWSLVPETGYSDQTLKQACRRLSAETALKAPHTRVRAAGQRRPRGAVLRSAGGSDVGPPASRHTAVTGFVWSRKRHSSFLTRTLVFAPKWKFGGFAEGAGRGCRLELRREVWPAACAPSSRKV